MFNLIESSTADVREVCAESGRAVNFIRFTSVFEIAEEIFTVRLEAFEPDLNVISCLQANVFLDDNDNGRREIDVFGIYSKERGTREEFARDFFASAVEWAEEMEEEVNKFS